MRVLVVGHRGQLGRELARQNWPAGTQIVGRSSDTDDISSRGVAAHLIETQKPTIVINAAAYTAVDRAETEIEKAYASNTLGPQYLAESCAQSGVPLIHVSTDYVFDGKKSESYVESDPVAPIGVYGQTKCDGEAAVRGALNQHLILRTAWLYSAFGNNFVKTMLRLATEQHDIRVVNDQRGSPTSAGDLAACITTLLPHVVDGTGPYGTYHATNAGETTWYGLAREIFEDLQQRTGRHVTLRAITTSEFPTAAHRPANSCLDCSLLERSFGIKMRNWQEALRNVLDELHKGNGWMSAS